MKVSVEISMYPLNEDFGAPILNFIKSLNNNAKLSVKTNSMSTQVFGEYQDVMAALQKNMEPVFADKMKTVMVMKFINADLDYNFE